MHIEYRNQKKQYTATVSAVLDQQFCVRIGSFVLQTNETVAAKQQIMLHENEINCFTAACTVADILPVTV